LELRPGFNRVLYFYFENNTFVLLHMFRKKHKRHQKLKWKKHIKNVMIIKFEMEENNYENMGRFQKGC
jgi:phage-related protein